MVLAVRFSLPSLAGVMLCWLRGNLVCGLLRGFVVVLGDGCRRGWAGQIGAGFCARFVVGLETTSASRGRPRSCCCRITFARGAHNTRFLRLVERAIPKWPHKRSSIAVKKLKPGLVPVSALHAMFFVSRHVCRFITDACSLKISLGAPNSYAPHANLMKTPAHPGRHLPGMPPFSSKRHQWSAEPGSAILRCCLARVSAGVTLAAADMSLFFQPETTSPSPFIIAS